MTRPPRAARCRRTWISTRRTRDFGRQSRKSLTSSCPTTGSRRPNRHGRTPRPRSVGPISSLVAEFFAEQSPEVSVSVEGPGTGDGFELFCEGETDISDASRPIDPEEAAVCEENGIEYTELEVALDGISVLTAAQG